MEINWQDVFYFTSSLAMIVFLITCIWLMWLLFNVSKLISNLKLTVNKWSNVINDVRYFRKDIQLKVIRFLLKILGKGNKDEKGGEKI